MAVKASRRDSSPAVRIPIPNTFRRHLPVWLLLAVVLVILAPNLAAVFNRTAGQAIARVSGLLGGAFAPAPVIAPLFTSEVEYWADDIQRWAAAYNLDPNLLATVMQIESCGHPTISSYAGAQGLFQVMPFHFATGENQLDPDTNARRGADFLHQCLTNFGKGDPGLALACYNGGPSVVSKPYTQWSDQTQRYYIWGMGIYTDAKTNQSRSDTLDVWLNKGGRVMCDWAKAELGI